MIVTVIINNLPFVVDCDVGTQNVAWLCLCACNMYGKTTWPTTNFLPVLAKNESGSIINPRLIIVKNESLIGEKIYVRVRKKYNEPNSTMTQEEKDWFNDAFLEGRFKMDVHIELMPHQDIRKNNRFKIEFSYDMEDRLLLFFPGTPDTLSIEVKVLGKIQTRFEANLKLPFGKLKVKKILFCEVGSDAFDKETTDFVKNIVKVNTSPEPLSEDEREKLLLQKEDKIRDKELKIQENIKNSEKEKIEQQIRFESIKKFMMQIPYSLDEVYQYVSKQIEMNEQDLVEIFEILERNEYDLFRKLFEIFLDYCKFYANNLNLTIDSVAVSNFLLLFFSKRPGLESITEEFENLYIHRLEKDIGSIDFREFIYIIIYILHTISLQKDVFISREFLNIPKTYENKLNIASYNELFKDIDVISVLNANHETLNEIFERYGETRPNSELKEMNSIHLFNLVKDISTKFKYNLVKLAKGEVKTEHNLDYFEFLRTVVAMALNLTEEKNPDTEELDISDPNKPEETNDVEFIGMKNEEAVGKLIKDLQQLLKEKK